jgi:hypothetical protein
MNPLRIDLGYSLDKNEKSSFNFAIDSDTPFKVFGLNWNFNFDHDFAIRPDADSGHTLYYKNTTGISMELPVAFTTAVFGFEEAFIVNEDNTGNSNYKKNRDAAYENYASSALFVSWKIPTPLAAGPFGYLTYTPKVSGNINYGLGEEIGALHKGPAATLSHSLGFGRINWIQNYRSGLEASVGNSNTYNFSGKDWANSFSVSATAHLPVAPFFGISGRLQYRQWFGNSIITPEQISDDVPVDPYALTPEFHPVSFNEAGDVLRGILNKAVKADYMLSLNMDFPFRVLRFLPSEWFNKAWLRFFNFEMHLSPIVDMALLSYYGVWSFESTGGIEAIVFPDAMRSIYVRASIGFNLKELVRTGKLPSGDNREIFIGLGHHY